MRGVIVRIRAVRRMRGLRGRLIAAGVGREKNVARIRRRRSVRLRASSREGEGGSGRRGRVGGVSP